jgi:hypothetical protein
MVLETEFTEAPFNVNVPIVEEEFPIVSTLVRDEDTSIAPIEREDVPILIPAVVAIPVLLNCAILQVFQSLEVKLGVQLVLVYHAVVDPVLVQGIVVAEFTANVLAALVPQVLPAVTVIFPLCPALPDVTVTDVVPSPLLMVQPVGTDQL